MANAIGKLAVNTTSGVLTTPGEEKSATRYEHQFQRNGNINHQHSKVHYQIVHAIPGRVRFRVPRLMYDHIYAHRLEILVSSTECVTKVRIKPSAASLAIKYESGSISDAEMRAHLAKIIQIAANSNIQEKTQTATAETTTSEENNIWSNLKLPILATSLAILGGPLGLPIPAIIVGSTIAITSLPVAKRAWEGIRQERKLNIDFLDFSAIAITTLQGQFLTPALMLCLIEIGDIIRERTARKSARQTLDLLDSLAEFVWVERDGEKQEIPIEQVQRGDTVIVYPGEQIPVDGRILRGQATIDEQKLTGESMPVIKQPGDEVYASTLVREGQIYIVAERVGSDTRAGASIKLMQEAPVHDTRIENYAAKIADRAVLPIILLASVVFGTTRNLARAASVLTLDFATGIRVSVPTTVLAALTSAARRGILIRSGRALEQFAKVNTFVFDKTGTLTQGEIAIVGVKTVNGMSAEQVIELAAAAEQRLTHPVACALVRYAEEQGLRLLPRGEWNYEIGLGVRANIEGQTVLVGSKRFLQQEGISLKCLYEEHPDLQTGSLIYVASDGELRGVLQYTDPLRPESYEVITQLQQAGIEVHMLTGDNWKRAKSAANRLGIPETNVHAEAFPETKANVVRELHESGRTVAFIGDGINDSAALAYADVSISFGNGSDIARETADVVLMRNDLQGLLEAIALARQAMSLIHQNTAIVAIPNLAGLIMAGTFGLNPLAATVVNNGSSILAGVNGLRPLLNRK
ncbi:MAG: heavy metal translocating P-type ATPase [Oscillatoriaceae bacterium SKW80]|nr:heavy metal translocating P-type ATPase [Oscillatoriaceae bacterium SKYG93]MCX8122262.1 heavy metal translocating P-type ATPase [Oscillatoriaceae bacterium SKW80]MDW8454548.1 heavy metal translocating P-type ATPase [Oscillatoriaceae cyanobacterium SKYGB_i_bin93]HIK29410.1 cadmium-translocating P-type ATPase [Oscillatoriaceae cyanobacterium M7585_C2015_266]